MSSNSDHPWKRDEQADLKGSGAAHKNAALVSQFNRSSVIILSKNRTRHNLINEFYVMKKQRQLNKSWTGQEM